MPFNDCFNIYCDWGLFNLVWLFGVWIAGSIFTFVTCCKSKESPQAAQTATRTGTGTGRTSTVRQTQGVIVAKTAPDSKQGEKQLTSEEERKKLYETAHDIDNEMSLRHADILLQEGKKRRSSELLLKQHYDTLHSQAPPTKQKPSNDNLLKNLVKQAMAKPYEKIVKVAESKEPTVQEAVEWQGPKESPDKGAEIKDAKGAGGKKLSRRGSGTSQTSKKIEKGAENIKLQRLSVASQRQKSATKMLVKKRSKDTKLGELLEPRKESVVKQSGTAKDVKGGEAQKEVDKKEQQRRESNAKNVDAKQGAPDQQRKESVPKKPTKEERHAKKAAILGVPQRDAVGGKEQKQTGAANLNPRGSAPPVMDSNFATQPLGEQPPKAPIYKQPYSRYFDPSIKAKDPSKSKKKDHRNYQSLFVNEDE